jgi:hypothetical protein
LGDSKFIVKLQRSGGALSAVFGFAVDFLYVLIKAPYLEVEE